MAITLVTVLCKEALIVRESELRDLDGPPPRTVQQIAQDCPRFYSDYVRCERIYWTTCEHCLKKKAEESETPVYDQDLLIWNEFNSLQREELKKQLFSTPYPHLVRTFPTAFLILKRYVLSGHKWVEAPEPTDEGTLGPRAYIDYGLQAAQWGEDNEVDESMVDEIQARLAGDPWWQDRWAWFTSLPSPCLPSPVERESTLSPSPPMSAYM
ncbi:hypothetical protein F5Y04DRAFT_285701 [Hypomontagnella monticulosa]|nr:hypothetical protein F5Y04DRAFT_285701 [Hypomontagnella monticulosa]